VIIHCTTFVDTSVTDVHSVESHRLLIDGDPIKNPIQATQQLITDKSMSYADILSDDKEGT